MGVDYDMVDSIRSNRVEEALMDPITITLIVSGLLLLWLIPNDVWTFALYLGAVFIVGWVFYIAAIMWLTS